MYGVNRTIIKTIVCFLYVCFSLVCMPTVVGKASDINPEQGFRELYLKLLETGDNSVQDISEWELPYMTCYDIANDVKNNEGFIAYHCYNQYNLMTVDEMDYISGTHYLRKFHMSTEDEEFLERYKKIKTLITEVQSNFDEKMTDLDKVLWIHEFVVNNLYYLDLEEIENHLGGATLVNGYGVCEGYAGAMMIFLKAENIPCETISGGGHEWVAVKIDGEWYQVDPTWDDTRSGSGGTHYFFMRNDEEFSKTMSKKHAEKIYSNALDETTGKVSTSIKYTDWYIHDVWDPMFYYDGDWYYVQNNAIKKNNIEGTKENVLYEGTNLQVTGIKDGVLNFNCNGKQQEMSLEQEIQPTVTAAATVTSAATVTNYPTITGVASENIKPSVSVIPTNVVTPTKGVIPTGTQKLTVTPIIKLKKPVIKSVKNKKGKKVKIVLKKKVSGAKGYQVAYSRDKKFKKSVKKVGFIGKTKTIGKLKKNRTYYIKVRAYKKDVNGKKIYGPYSKVKKVKIKK